MRLFLLTAVTMTAFAANSVLNRMALAEGGIDAVSFGTIRLAAGALTLALLCWLMRGGLRLGGPARVTGVLSLLLYIYGFSLAYDVLDAGLGALILFGVVQITMFAGGILAREPMPPLRWAGAGLAFAGLAWLLWPGAGVPVSPPHGALMAAAGVGWGLYSLAGRRGGDALQATAANFIIAVPLGVALGFPAAGARRCGRPDDDRRDRAGDRVGRRDLGHGLRALVQRAAGACVLRGGGRAADGAGDRHGGRHALPRRGAERAVRAVGGAGARRGGDFGPRPRAGLIAVKVVPGPS